MPVELIAQMLRQLPPSASELKLLDLGGHCIPYFTARRTDLNAQAVQAIPADAAGLDAIVALEQALASDFLAAAWRSLRPGGRLIIGWQRGRPDAGQQVTLEAAGFVRILIETQGGSLLLRGERPWTVQHTRERIRQVAAQDEIADPAAWPGRHVHLLIREASGRPPWARPTGASRRWQAISVGAGAEQRLAAFSSLPRAVAFLQPAALRGRLVGVNRIGKFPREAVDKLPLPLLLNPAPEVLEQVETDAVEVDAALAALPDE